MDAAGPPSSKRARLSAPTKSVDALIEELKASVDALARTDTHAFTLAHLKQLSGVSASLVTKEFEVKAAHFGFESDDADSDRESLSEQLRAPPEEVVLPLDLLVTALVNLVPAKLGVAAQVCRHFRAAVGEAVKERVTIIGLQHTDLREFSYFNAAHGLVSGASTEALHKIEEDVQKAASLINQLDSEPCRRQLQRLDNAVLHMHQGTIVAYLERLVQTGVHRATNSAAVREVTDIVKILRFNFDAEVVARHFHTIFTLLTEAGTDALRISALELTGRAFVPSPRLAWSSPLSAGLADVPEVEDWASKVAAMLLEVDPELGAFKELLARREDKEWGVLTSALRVVGSMPNSVLRLLRDDLVRISTAHDGHDEQSCTAGQRKLARQMLIDLDFSTVSSGRRCSW